MNKRMFALLLTLAITLQCRNAEAQSSALDYLRHIADQYQQTVIVHTRADDAGNHFAARGRMASPGGQLYVPVMDEISVGGPCMKQSCITAQFLSRGNNWGGWYFMNGVLGAKDRQPIPNWGDWPDAGYDLSGATKLEFIARGKAGGERVEFFVFGVGNTESPRMPYPDSALKQSLGEIVLSTTWTKYEIPLHPNLNLQSILGGFGWVADATSNPHDITFYLADIQYVKTRPGQDRFLVSYETLKSTDAFDVVQRNAGFVYDNIVAAIAFAAAGDLAHARYIGNAVLAAQSHDRFFKDGRIRNAYQGGDLLLPPGWLPNGLAATMRMPGWYDAVQGTWFEDEYHVSTNTGNVAWGMIGLLYLYETTKEQKYLDGAARLGDWITTNTEDFRGAGGFTGGYEGWEGDAVSGTSGSGCASGVRVNGQCKRLYKSTEHNIDLYSAFSRLYIAQKEDKWRQKAQKAKAFFLSTWDAAEGKFWTGTTEDGVTIFKDVVPLDTQVWSIMALGAEATPYLRALDYVESHHKTALGYGFKQNGGNSCGDKTWFEGSSQVAAAYAAVGNLGRWSAILNGIRPAQLASGALPATDGNCLNTGFTLNDGQPWMYFPRAHIGASAWLSVAESKANPFRSDLYAAGALPTLSEISPAFGARGSTLSVTVLGANFVTGQTSVSLSGNGDVTVGTVNVNSPDRLTVQIVINAGAIVGPRVVAVTTPAGTSNNVTFNVRESSGLQPPTLTGISPASAVAGSVVEVVLDGTNFDAGNTSIAVSGGNFGFHDLDVAGVVFLSPTKLKASFAISPTAASGPREVTVATSAGTSKPLTFVIVPSANQLFVIPDRGGISATTEGSMQTVVVGHACVIPAVGSLVPAGFAIFGFRQGGNLISEASVPVSPSVREGILFAELDEKVNTGVAIGNPNAESVVVSYSFTSSNGTVVRSGGVTIPGHGQIASFIDQSPFALLAPMIGTMSFSASAPVSAIALRGLVNERSEFLFTTLPVVQSTSTGSAPLYFPHFADGGGWETQVVLVNPTNQRLTGTLQFIGPGTADSTGTPLAMTVDGQTGTTFAYSIEPRSSRRLRTMNSSATTITSGSVLLMPSAGTGTPSGQVIFSFHRGGVVVSETGVANPTIGAAFRIYAEVSDDLRLQTGIAIANPSPAAVVVTVELTDLDGKATALAGSVRVPGNGQVAKFLTELPGFSSLRKPFQGVLRIVGPSSGISVVGLRGRTNERGDFFLAATPAANESSPPSTEPLYFAHFVDGGGYTTQFVLVANPGGPSSVTTCFLSQSGAILNPKLKIVGGIAATAPPRVLQSVPSSGSVDGGTIVTLYGESFASGATVRFGNAAATNVLFMSSTALQVSTPPGAGTVSVTVTNPDGQSATLNGAFTYQNSAPVVSLVSPASGPTAGGTVVVVTGSDFASGATVKFGTASGTSVTFLSATSLRVSSPAGAAGAVTITVTNPDGKFGTLPNAYTYAAPAAPTATGISPTTGPVSGGTGITITGTNFVSGATVRVGSIAATGIVFVNATTLQALTPAAGTGTVSVMVTNPDGQSATLNGAFTYQNPAPVVSSVSPVSGPTAGGAVVVVTGSNFASGATVKFGTASGTSVTFLSATSLRVSSPAGTAGAVTITVTNPDGRSGILPNAYTYVAPTVTNPSIQASIQGGTVSGTVSGVSPTQSFRVVIYARTNFYYVQPCITEATNLITSNGTWGPIDSHNGDIYALLVRDTYSPPVLASSLPSVDGVNVLAGTGRVGTIVGHDVSRCPAQ